MVSVQCEKGETTLLEGSTSCSACGIGEYGNTPGNCTTCPDEQYQNEKKQIKCLVCKKGEKPNDERTGCEKPQYTVAEDW